jgi:hypothetical protein
MSFLRWRLFFKILLAANLVEGAFLLGIGDVKWTAACAISAVINLFMIWAAGKLHEEFKDEDFYP